MAWQNFRGAYNNTGPYYNVVVGGNPNKYGDYGIDLTTAHNSGYGYGIKFEDDGNYGVTFTLNLVAYSVSDTGKYVANGKYVAFGGTYNYFLKVSTSNNNGATYDDIFNEIIFKHNDSGALCYRSGWGQIAKASQWHKKFQLPTDTTHVRIELYGEDATFPHSNIYPITVIIPDFRPFAVRKEGKFKSVDTKYGKLRVRNLMSWTDVPVMSVGDTGKVKQGSCWIRHNNQWVGQARVGD